MVFLFNRTIKNILSNYIPHEIIIYDDRNPPWIHNRVKELINEKSDTFQCYLHSNKDPNLFNKLFKDFFANQCSLIKNPSVLLSVLFKRTENVISSIDFGLDDIAKIIQKIDPNKAPGRNMISMRMLKICGHSIYKPLQLIFRSCIENGKFPSEWNKAHVAPVRKKGNKQTVGNYRPVSLLPICSKIFER